MFGKDRPAAAPAVAVVGLAMGLGHLRAARPLAAALGAPLLRLDRPPLASPAGARLWQLATTGYEVLSRASERPVTAAPARAALAALTTLDDRRTALAQRLVGVVAGGPLFAAAAEALALPATVVATYFLPALLAERGCCERVLCQVTDVDLHRAWVAVEAERSRIEYLVPGERAAARLARLGVAAGRIHRTGFPLPEALAREAAATSRLAGRLARLDPAGAFRRGDGRSAERALGGPLGSGDGPPLLVMAVGGAGAQTGTALALVAGLAPLARAGRLRLGLAGCVVGRRRRRLEDAVAAAARRGGLDPAAIELHLEAGPERYFPRFDDLLGRADLLWTKPSELTFYGALGLPLVLSSPLGEHERANRAEALRLGFGLPQGEPAAAARWVGAWLASGDLARAAWAGFAGGERRGAERAAEVVGRRR